LTQQQFVVTLNDVAHTTVSIMNVENAAYCELLMQSGVPEAYISMLAMNQQGMNDGALEAVHSDLEKLLGRPATPLAQTLEKLVH